MVLVERHSESDEAQAPATRRRRESSQAADRLNGAMRFLSEVPILVVDDDPVSCRLIGEILAGEGYVTELADSPVEALEMISRTPHQMIVSDVRMPGMSGLALASHVQQKEADLPILLVTSSPDLTTQAEARALNVPVLPKPFVPRVLLERVHDLLGDGSSIAEDNARGT